MQIDADEEVRTKKEKSERKISYEVDQIERSHLKEELKGIEKELLEKG